MKTKGLCIGGPLDGKVVELERDLPNEIYNEDGKKYIYRKVVYGYAYEGDEAVVYNCCGISSEYAKQRVAEMLVDNYKVGEPTDYWARYWKRKKKPSTTDWVSMGGGK